MPVPFELRTDRMQLRRLGTEHLDDLVELDSDPEVMRHISDGVPTPRSAYEQEFLPRIIAFDEHPYGFLAAYHEGRFVGWFHLRPSSADESMLELGYRLQRAVWGRGLATEGGRALVRYAFDALDQATVDACALPGNTASMRVMEKCGMHRVGVFRHPRVPKDVVRYWVHRSDRSYLDYR